MCECGCVTNDERYTFPAPGSHVYVLTISGGCTSCDAGPGITLERISLKRYREHHHEFVDGSLAFEKWPDSEGAAIITGHRRHEFVKACLSHLVGVSSEEMGENGIIDESGADVILEEMYEDARFRPRIVTPVRK